MCKTERDSHRKQTNGYQRGEGRGRGVQVRRVGLRDTCVCVCVCVYCCFIQVQLFATPRTAAHRPPLSMRFSKQDYCIGLPFSSLGDLPDPGIQPALAGSFFTLAPLGTAMQKINEQQDIPHSTGNYSHYLVITFNGV